MATVEIEFGIVDTTAKSDATLSLSNSQTWDTDSDLTLAETPAINDIATLEVDYWALDGTKAIHDPTDTTKHYGWVSTSMTGVDSTFPVPPAFTATFTADHTSAGLTFDFAGDSYPTSITAVFYDLSNAVIASQTITPDGMHYAWVNTVENYRKIVLTFNAMSKPFRWLKMSGIQYGLIQIFGDSNLISASIVEEISPISDEIPIDTLEFAAHSYDSYFSILNPAGAYAALQQRQKMTVRKKEGATKTDIGFFFLSEWANESQNISNMKAVDVIGLLDNLAFPETYYQSATAVSVIVAEIFSHTGIAHNLNPAYAGVTLTGKIGAGTCREALQQVAFAIGAVVDANRSETVYIKPANTVVSGNIGYDVKTLDQTLTMRTLVTGVEVTAHSYSGTADTQTIVGKYAASLPLGTPSNVLQVTDATMISTANATAAAQRVYDYYQKRYQYDITAVIDAERAGQLVTVDSWNGQKIRGIIETISIDLVGGFIADLTVVGEVDA